MILKSAARHTISKKESLIIWITRLFKVSKEDQTPSNLPAQNKRDNQETAIKETL